MTDINVLFCRTLLAQARQAAKEEGVQLPKRLTALRSDKHSFFIEGTGVRGEYVRGDNAYHAKANYIFHLIDRVEQAKRK